MLVDREGASSYNYLCFKAQENHRFSTKFFVMSNFIADEILAP